MHPLAGDLPRAARVNVDHALVATLESSFRLLAPSGEQLVAQFYTQLFAEYPHLRGMFPKDMKAQEQKLLQALGTVIDGLRNPDAVRDTLRNLGATHAEKGVRPEHYPPVCRILVATMRSVLGPHWSVSQEQAWTSAIEQVSRLMIEGAGAPPHA